MTETKRNQIINSNEWKEIFEHSEDYPPVLLEDLKRNPEMLDFVKKYPGEQSVQDAGLTFREKLQKYPLFIQWDQDGDISHMDRVILGYPDAVLPAWQWSYTV